MRDGWELYDLNVAVEEWGLLEARAFGWEIGVVQVAPFKGGGNPVLDKP